MNDKCFAMEGDLLIIIEGYILNKKELMDCYSCSSMNDLVSRMYRCEGETFFSSFRGCFSGALYDTQTETWYVFTDHLGTSPVFYEINDGFFCAGNQVNYLLSASRKEKVSLRFDEQAAYQMLTFGFMEQDNTFAEQIKRLRGGNYLKFWNNRAEICTYYELSKNTKRFEGKSDSFIINELDECFRKAVSLEFDKDREYNYKHIADMSGGLDSRMTVWVAHDIFPDQIQLLTYCKANYLDELIAKQIAEYWKDEILVKPLDDCSFFLDIDENVNLLNGLSAYGCITGGNRMLKSLNLSEYGLEHTGMVGDSIVGSFYSDIFDGERMQPSGRFSEKLSKKVDYNSENFHNIFYDHEIYLIYTRGIQGASNTYALRKNYTEVASPFLYLDFVQLCLDIPLEKRINHGIYKKWIIEKYPKAAEFRWEKINGKITEPDFKLKLRKIITRGPSVVLRKLMGNRASDNGMNPLDYWLEHNDFIRTYMDQYAENGYTYLPMETSDQLVLDMKQLYNNGSALEKMMVLTVLGAAKMYFGEDEHERIKNKGDNC